MEAEAKGAKNQSVVALRLRQARLRVKMSQKMLGIKAGIDEFAASPRINQYERGVHVPDLKTVERLAKVLGVPAPYFYARDDGVAEVILNLGKLNERARAALRAELQRRIESEGK